MSLSDEILARPGAIAPIRHLLSELVSELGARSAFLVDEAGTPFGAFGNVEFPLPYPISSLTGRAGGDPLLEALLGEGREAHSPTLIVHRVNPRALLAIELDQPLADPARRAALKRVKTISDGLVPLLTGPLNSSSASTYDGLPMRKGTVILIERSTEIARPIQDVFEFYETPANFRRVTEGVAGIELERLPSDFRPGSVFAYRLRGWPVDLRWEALLSEYQPPERFVNVQANGQFLEWSHEHHFAQLDRQGNTTRVRELLTYRMPKGLVNSLAHRLYVRQKLEEFVTASLDNARQLLEASAKSKG